MDEFVVAYNTYNPGGAWCPAGGGPSNETAVFTNTNSGLGAWNLTFRTCPYSWAFARVTSSYVNGAPAGSPGLFHLFTLAIALPVDGRVFPYDCKSTNGGSSWPVCTALSPGPFMPKPAIDRNCYGGDYQGATADPAHGRFFYAWGQPAAYTATQGIYNILGNTNDP
jgi:hypothetical protein